MPSPAWRAALTMLARLPQGAMSRGFGRMADIPIPRALRRSVLGSFARGVGIDLSEAELPLAEYPTLNAFFVRRLRPGAREWPSTADILASPVDGIAGQTGRVEKGKVLQAKGRWYSVGELLGDEEEAGAFEGGAYITLYLSPRHYHRIHAPVPGHIASARHIPGALLPVNAAAVAHVPDLFARNERLLCYLEGALGRVAVVAVGAYNVGRISAAFDPAWNAPDGRSGWVTNRGAGEDETHHYDPPIAVAAAEEIMAFHLGSTVVLLTEPGRVELENIRPGDPVSLGQQIGRAAV